MHITVCRGGKIRTGENGMKLNMKFILVSRIIQLFLLLTDGKRD